MSSIANTPTLRRRRLITEEQADHRATSTAIIRLAQSGPGTGERMARPHPGMHVVCPQCEGPIPDLLGELTDEPAGINVGTRATDCYYFGAPLLCPGLGLLLIAPGLSPPARR